jgi:predicted XRE-type DNA-binding protein
MAKKVKPNVARNAKELAEVMGLTPSDAVEWELRYSLTQKIIEMAERNRLSVTQIAKRSKTSRARVTHVLKGDSQGISIDVLLRILGATGQTIRISYIKAKAA